MAKGNISVHTENLFPIIKKFLYSDHEIFLRELISNAVDATQKLSVLSDKGEVKGEKYTEINLPEEVRDQQLRIYQLKIVDVILDLRLLLYQL